ncbi:MAG: hypothetical protein HZA03_07955 [Nitrospinae bacterium]|nr:hypothetical protein [Nitrospinota bacterium]
MIKPVFIKYSLFWRLLPIEIVHPFPKQAGRKMTKFFFRKKDALITERCKNYGDVEVVSDDV